MRSLASRFWSILLSVVLVVGFIPTAALPSLTFPSEAYAHQAIETSYTGLAVFGDSISTGFGPLMNDNTWTDYFFTEPREGSYPALLRDDLGLDSINSVACVSERLVDALYVLGEDVPDVNNHFPDVYDTDTITYLQDAQAYESTTYTDKLTAMRDSGQAVTRVENSDLILLNIGQADMFYYPETCFNVNYDISTNVQLIYDIVNDYLDNYDKLLDKIDSINPDAKIVLMSMYNPYVKFECAGEDEQAVLDVCSDVLELANARLQLIALNNPDKYVYVDVTDVAEYIDDDTVVVPEGSLLETLIAHENHAGAAGNQYIEDQILAALDLTRPSVAPSMDDSTSYLAFTSDTHVSDSGSSVTRLDNWLDNVSAEQGSDHNTQITFDYVGICGDLGNAAYGSVAYRNKVQYLMDKVDQNTHVKYGIYTTGNHEWSPGDYANTYDEAPYTSVTRLGEAANSDKYQIFCFGAAQYNQQFNQDDIDALAEYLASADKTKPVFIMSHFPLHSISTRTSINAQAVIDVLNQYPNAVFLWGHNHTESDTHYGQVYTGDIDGTAINFTYCAAGCMSDADYSTGSGNTEEKGLVAAMDGDSTFTLTYYGNDYEPMNSYIVNIGETISTAEEVDLAAEDMDSNYNGSVYSSADTLEEGEYAITYGKIALNSEADEGYTTLDTNYYTYKGLTGARVAIANNKLFAGLAEDEAWLIKKVDGGYTIQNRATEQYLTAYYHTDVGADIDLEDEPGTNGVWAYVDGHLMNVATGKYLNYQTDADISGTLQSGSADFFTIRSNTDDEMALYSLNSGGQTVVTSNYCKTDTFVDGSWYVLSAEGKAMTSEFTDGYVNSKNYMYQGLKGNNITTIGSYVTSKVTKDMLWQAEAVDGGFALKNQYGQYLNATYTTLDGYAGLRNICLGDTPQAWVLSGTTLINVPTGNKYLTYDTDADIDGGATSGSGEFFTLHSSASDEISVYLSAVGCNEEANINEVLDKDNEVVDSEIVPFYKQVTGELTDGSKVIFATTTNSDGTGGKVMTDEANSGFKNCDTSSKYYFYSGLGTADLGATAGSDISKLDVSATAWTVEKVDEVDGGYRFKNDEGKYLSATYGTSGDYKGNPYSGVGNVNLLDTPDDSSVWIYSISDGAVTLKNNGCNRVLAYNDGTSVNGTLLDPASASDISVFTVRSSNKFKLCVYEQTEKEYYLESSSLQDGSSVVFAYSTFYMGSSKGIGYINHDTEGLYYRYGGLSADALDATASTSLTRLSSVTTGMLWTVEAVDGGYVFKNPNGRYLSASLTTGTLDVTEGGEYITVACSGNHQVSLVSAPDDSCVWTVSFDNGVADLVNVACGLHLTYNKPGDINGTCLDPSDSSTVSVFTARSSRTHSLYIYQSFEKTTIPVESDNDYILVNSEGYALSSDDGEGYIDANSNYRYDGRDAVSVEVDDDSITSTITTDLVWKFTESGKGYTIQNSAGQYLTSQYVQVEGGAKGEGVNVYFADDPETPEVWDVAEGYLKSETTGKYLSRQTNSGTASVFTLRSNTADAQPFTFYHLTDANTATALYAATVGGYASQVREALNREAYEAGTEKFTGATAIARDGYAFAGWYSGDELISSDEHFTPTEPGIYQAKFVEKQATIIYQPALLDDAGNVEDIKLSSESETVNVVSGTVQGSAANKVDGYTFLYWTSDKEGTNVVSIKNYYAPATPSEDETYYAWYQKDYECTVTEPVLSDSPTAGIHDLIINGTNFGSFVFAAVDGGWTIYSADEDGYLSFTLGDTVFDDDVLEYSSVAKTWTWDASEGFYVETEVDVWLDTITVTTYLTSSSDELTLDNYIAASSTRFQDMKTTNYYYHDYAYSSLGDTQHTGTCARCGDVVTEDHSMVYKDNGDGTHTFHCEKCEFTNEPASHVYACVEKGEGAWAVECVCGHEGATTSHMPVLGDANGNGKINITDAQVVYGMASGAWDSEDSLYGKLLAALNGDWGWDAETLTFTADANQDGAVDATDARAIQSHILTGSWA